MRHLVSYPTAGAWMRTFEDRPGPQHWFVTWLTTGLLWADLIGQLRLYGP